MTVGPMRLAACASLLNRRSCHWMAHPYRTSASPSGVARVAAPPAVAICLRCFSIGTMLDRASPVCAEALSSLGLPSTQARVRAEAELRLLESAERDRFRSVVLAIGIGLFAFVRAPRSLREAAFLVTLCLAYAVLVMTSR